MKRSDVNGKSKLILLVDDNPGDARLTQEALDHLKSQNRLDIVIDGVEAIQYLKHQGKYFHSQRPDLILLDLNLPKKNGRDVLIEIKTDQNLRQIPVVILTTSQSEEDITFAYQLGANCFITKPQNLTDFFYVIEVLEKFWLSIVTLPAAPNPQQTERARL